uniref:EF-hand domain-containing protein n=1 Tax=uncultured prokaryote TaxID=198431 RepID=H5SN66_9ZZZZ|nr:hypothetical protein HGMM_F51E10C14 [uncultured prokaryote]
MTFGLVALMVALMASRLLANDPFVYFAGNPANSWYVVGGTCDSPTLTANYLYFISGDVSSAGLPARWTAIPFELCQTTTFDSIAYAPAFGTGAPILRVLITGATTTTPNCPGGARPIPNLNNVLYDSGTNLGFYPGDPPVSGQKDEAMLTYYGDTTTFLYLRTTSLGQTITLPPGLYFAIIVGDEDFQNCGPLDSYIALAMGAPGGPKLYYTPRGAGSNCSAPASWQLFRYNTSVAPFTCERMLNTDLPWRSGDPFASCAPWNSVPDWNRYHSPQLYHGVLGFRYSGTGGGNVTGTVTAGSAQSPLTNVEVIFYKPGTKQRIARFSMPTATAPGPFTIDLTQSVVGPTSVAAGTYDIVVRPVYSPTTISINCPTSLCVTGVTFNPNTHWVGKRFSSVTIPAGGTVDLGSFTLPNGDTNGDGCIDDADLLNVLFGFGSDDAAADVNDDGTVDDADLLDTLFNFGICEDGDETCGG